MDFINSNLDRQTYNLILEFAGNLQSKNEIRYYKKIVLYEMLSKSLEINNLLLDNYYYYYQNATTNLFLQNNYYYHWDLRQYILSLLIQHRIKYKLLFTNFNNHIDKDNSIYFNKYLKFKKCSSCKKYQLIDLFMKKNKKTKLLKKFKTCNICRDKSYKYYNNKVKPIN